MIKCRLFPSLLGVLMLLSVATLQASPRVVFINPDRPGNPFWDKVVSVMRAAADDLSLQLDVVYGEANRELATEQALGVIRRDPPVDYLIYIYQVGKAPQILEAAERAGVHSVIFNTEVADSERSIVGVPGEPYTRWIAHLVPDDRQAGGDLAHHLIMEWTSRKDAPPAEIVGFNGGRDSSAARLRAAGLEQALTGRSDARLHQVLVSEWNPQLAADQSEPLLRRWPGTNVIWSASDAMALAVIERQQRLGRQPGSDLVVGSIDWTDAGIQAVESGHLAVTLGGHFLEGAWALVLIHDHAQGRVSINEMRRLSTPLAAIHRGNVGALRDLLIGNQWGEIDFRRYSRALRGNQAAYVFQLEPPSSGVPKK